MTTDTGRVGKPTGLSQAEPASSLGPSGFDSARLRAIPVWMTRDMAPGWQEHGTSAYHGADAIGRLEAALAHAIAALHSVGDDYPGSSCQKWCHDEAEAALDIASGARGFDAPSPGAYPARIWFTPEDNSSCLYIRLDLHKTALRLRDSDQEQMK